MISLGQIQSNTEQLLKLMADAQTKSRKRKREEQEQVRDDNEQAEILQDQNQPRTD